MNIFSSHPNREYIQIVNNTDKEIFIKKKFNIESINHYWSQTINDIDLIIEDNQYLFKIAPGKFNDLVKYFPNYGPGLPSFSESYRKLDEISIIEKITSILKSLEITDSDGRLLLTLSDLKAGYFIKKVVSYNQNFYKIIISN
jgi:hypothetical protein